MACMSEQEKGRSSLAWEEVRYIDSERSLQVCTVVTTERSPAVLLEPMVMWCGTQGRIMEVGYAAHGLCGPPNTYLMSLYLGRVFFCTLGNTKGTHFACSVGQV